MVNFGKRLKALRTKSGYTQKELAQKLGLTKSVISAYENDLRLPSLDILVALSRIFRVTTDYLLGVQKDVKQLDLSGLNDEELDVLIKLIQIMRKQ